MTTTYKEFPVVRTVTVMEKRIIHELPPPEDRSKDNLAGLDKHRLDPVNLEITANHIMDYVHWSKTVEGAEYWGDVHARLEAIAANLRLKQPKTKG